MFNFLNFDPFFGLFLRTLWAPTLCAGLIITRASKGLTWSKQPRCIINYRSNYIKEKRNQYVVMPCCFMYCWCIPMIYLTVYLGCHPGQYWKYICLAPNCSWSNCELNEPETNQKFIGFLILSSYLYFF